MPTPSRRSSHGLGGLSRTGQRASALPAVWRRRQPDTLPSARRDALGRIAHSPAFLAIVAGASLQRPARQRGFEALRAGAC